MRKIYVLLASTLAIIALGLIGFYNRDRFQPQSSSETFEADQNVYEFKDNTRVLQEGQPPQEVVNVDADLLVYKQNPGEIVSRWVDIRKFMLGDKVIQPEDQGALLSGSHIMTFGGKDAIFFTDAQFPSDLVAIHNFLIQRLQIPMLPTSSKTITRQELEETGRFEVEYTFETLPTGYRVKRNWVKALSGDFEVVPGKSGFTYTYNSKSVLLSMNGNLSFQNKKSLGTFVESVFNIAIKSEHTKQKTVARLDLSKLTPVAGADATTNEGYPEGMTIPQLFELVDSFKDSASGREDFNLFKALTDDLHQHPEHLKDYKNKILSIKERDDDGERRINMLATVLADSNTPKGAMALAELGKECPDTYCKSQVMMGYTFHTTPTKESTAAVLKVAQTEGVEEVYGAAYHAVGEAATKLGDTYPEVKNELLNDLSTSKDENKMRAIVGGMGNLASPDFEPVIEEAAKSTNEDLRVSSFRALRKIPDPKVNPVLLQSFQKEPVTKVNDSIVEAMFDRTFTTEEYTQIAKRSLDFTDNDNMQRNVVLVLTRAHENGVDGIPAILEDLKAQTTFETLKEMIDSELAKSNETIKALKEQDEILKKE
ncbi:MAG: HEAT repeat domain-containing protein [Chitinophagaceae bacterium]|nr:HEAT repeat domain-containing protein [Oligoflexus sp.]